MAAELQKRRAELARAAEERQRKRIKLSMSYYGHGGNSNAAVGDRPPHHLSQCARNRRACYRGCPSPGQE